MKFELVTTNLSEISTDICPSLFALLNPVNQTPELVSQMKIQLLFYHKNEATYRDRPLPQRTGQNKCSVGRHNSQRLMHQ